VNAAVAALGALVALAVLGAVAGGHPEAPVHGATALAGAAATGKSKAGRGRSPQESQFLLAKLLWPR